MATREHLIADAVTKMDALRAVADGDAYAAEAAAVATALDTLYAWAVSQSMTNDSSGLVGMPLIRLRQIRTELDDEVARREALP